MVCHKILCTSWNVADTEQIFCGADEFSAFSLRALRELQQQKPFVIESIEVLCKTDKAVGRGLKQSRSPPIKSVATELGLRTHQIDSFRDWRSEPYNLVVAVSFGLLVPARILNNARYGGLNVHPSLLPDLRGAAPITHALLKRRTSTGVSLQTMHPTKFDHGVVLSQTEEVPVLPNSTPDSLLKKLGPLGADLLRKGVEDAVFVPPLQDARAGLPVPPQVKLAPKIIPSDRCIDWQGWTADEILHRDRVLGDLWDAQTWARCRATLLVAEYGKRITFHGPWATAKAGQLDDATAGEPLLVLGPFRSGLTLGVKTADGCIVAPESVTIEGKKTGKGLQALVEDLRKREKGEASRASRRRFEWR